MGIQEVVGMPEMSEENYQALLTAIEDLRQENDNINKRLSDMTAMNKALLNSRGGSQQVTQDTSKRQKELYDKLQRSIK